jgi:8-oxo-dGTP diphosphatase
VRADDDGGWRLPRAEVRPKEYLAACAARSVATEASVRVTLGVPLTEPGKGPVARWRATAAPDDVPVAGPGIAEVAWLPATSPNDPILDPRDQRAIRRALELADTVAIVVVRHGKAMQRSNWSGRDQARPLDERGRRQSAALVPLLGAYGVTQLASSTSKRCVKTLEPFGRFEQLEIEGWSTFSEEQAESDPKAVERLIRRLASRALDSSRPLALCGHRPVLPAMLKALGVSPQSLKPAACVVVHLDPSGGVAGFEHHAPRL